MSESFLTRARASRNAPVGDQFDAAFNKLGKYTSGFSAPSTGMQVAQLKSRDFASQNLIQKIGAVGSQSLDIAGSIAGATGRFVKNSVVDIYQAAYLSGKSLIDIGVQTEMNSNNARMAEELNASQARLVNDYRAGRVSREDYNKALLDLSKANSEISKSARKIHQDVAPIKRALAVAETAVNILSLGTWGLAGVGGKQAFKAGSINVLKGGKVVATRAIDKNAISALVRGAANPLEKMILRVPASRALIERNISSIAKREAQKLAGESTAQFITRESKNIAIDLLIKRPVFYQSNIGYSTDIYNKIIEGDYPSALGSAAFLSTQMINGGPLGLVSGGASWLKRTSGKLAYGKGSVIDEISKQIGNKNPKQIADFLRKLEGKKGFDENHNTFRLLQEVNLRANKENVDEAARSVLQHYIQNNIPLESITPKTLAKDMGNWAKAEILAQKTLTGGKVVGISPADAKKYVVVRWDAATKRAIAATVIGAGDDVSARLAALEAMADQPGAGWSNNDILMKNLRSLILKNEGDVGKEILSINTASVQLKGVPKKVADELNKLGFSIARPAKGRLTPVIDLDDTRKLVTGAVDGNTEIFDPVTAPQPTVAAIAGIFRKFGLSPVEADSAATRKLSESVAVRLDELDMSANLGLVHGRNKDVVNGGRAILSRLQTFIENKRGALGLKNSAVSDIRQLTISEVSTALKITDADARLVSRALIKGYTDIPMDIRGLGDYVVDRLYQLPHHKYYSRVQSALRYTYNPFFRTQERVETKLLSHAKATNLVWNKSRSTLDDTARLLDEGGIFTSSLPGEAAQDQVLGRITANITNGQKRDLAGLALDMAESRGISVQQMVNEHADEIDDALRVVVQYPRKGLLASPLSRTMNLMFFPMRYNLKVTQIAAEVLSKQPPSVQMGVIHSGFKIRDWLKSDEGIIWQSEHADAIQVLSWLTPINSIQYSLNLLSHRPDSVAELGQLGGLPLGFITQILDSQGVIHLNRPYVNPKTGEVIPDYVPQTDKARASVALIDLLGTMFTYPGRTLGLPGKQASIRAVVKDFIATNGSDFEKRMNTDKLTDLQKKWIEVLNGDTSDEAIDALYNAPSEGEFNWYTLPPLSLPLETPNVQFEAPKTSSKKFARPIPRAQ